ncbi:MAG: hypothetical protein E6Q37_06630 [Crocinitomicaceae bacterium]|nr:MAG: hypothetical protein E6Q37_06630 [Crocinitomicaceae bacterium]
MKYNYDLVLEYILSQQDEDGSFITYRINPKQYPNQKVKRIPDPSPFLTANILYSLMCSNDVRFETIIERGQQFLISMGTSGFWRFWPKNTQSDVVPFDLDDTAICSFVLKDKITFDNRKVISRNVDKNGYFYTWLRPSFRFFVSHPSEFSLFIKSIFESFKTLFRKKLLGLSDKEPAVAANVLLYLGQSDKNKKCIEIIIKEVETQDFELQFYEDEICLYYHISRAYKNGISSFQKVSDIICNRIAERVLHDSELTDLHKVMAANVLLDFGGFHDVSSLMIHSLIHSSKFPDKWEADTYFCGKQRIFQAGSPVLTAALLVEAMAKLNRNEK